MKITTLSVMMGLTATTMLSINADAAFTGVSLDVQETAYGRVHDLYVDLDSPIDMLLGVAGAPFAPLEITTDGTFYQHALGSDTAPNPFLFATNPGLEFDTFVTTGSKTSLGDFTFLTPTWPGFGASSLTTATDGWLSLVPVAPVDGRVLIGRFTTVNATELSGTMTIAGMENGQLPFEHVVEFHHAVPAPGALALLGLAGAVGIRRRRK